MNSKANNELSFPQSRRSGTRMSSKIFIVATTVICTMAFNFDLNLVKIQIAITISESPIKTVNGLEYSSPKILATICSCRGTRFSTLQTGPLASQTVAIINTNTFCRFFLFNS